MWNCYNKQCYLRHLYFHLRTFSSSGSKGTCALNHCTSIESAQAHVGVGQGRCSGQASRAPHPTRQREKQCEEPKVINSACYSKDQNSCQHVTKSKESLSLSSSSSFYFLSSKHTKPLPTEEHHSIAQQLGVYGRSFKLFKWERGSNYCTPMFA